MKKLFNKEDGVWYDSFEPFQKINIQEFTFLFKPNRYVIWKNQKKIEVGENGDDVLITNREKQTANGTVSEVSFAPIAHPNFDFDNPSDANLHTELSIENEFDLCITQNDRVQLIKIPSSGNGDNNMAISALKMMLGATRGHTDFKSNEPYCCNIFQQDGQLAKITFSFSNPEKIIEFYSQSFDDRKRLNETGLAQNFADIEKLSDGRISKKKLDDAVDRLMDDKEFLEEFLKKLGRQ
ncbi:MAG: hypothetical protein ABGW56_03255 [Flavobacteriaceae bacterium]